MRRFPDRNVLKDLTFFIYRRTNGESSGSSEIKNPMPDGSLERIVAASDLDLNQGAAADMDERIAAETSKILRLIEMYGLDAEYT